MIAHHKASCLHWKSRTNCMPGLEFEPVIPRVPAVRIWDSAVIAVVTDNWHVCICNRFRWGGKPTKQHWLWWPGFMILLSSPRQKLRIFATAGSFITVFRQYQAYFVMWGELKSLDIKINFLAIESQENEDPNGLKKTSGRTEFWGRSGSHVDSTFWTGGGEERGGGGENRTRRKEKVEGERGVEKARRR